MSAVATAVYIKDSIINRNKQVRNEMAPWLQQFDWQWWVTLTFRYEVQNAYKAREYFLRWVSEYLQLRVWNDIDYFVAVERFHSGYGTHLHALLNGVETIRYADAGQAWFKRFGYARIEKFQKNLGAEHYLTKYITKEICDWDLKVTDLKNQKNENQQSGESVTI